jgi:hypothetical protein
MVNGIPKMYSAYTLTPDPFGTRAEINVTPFIKVGQKNRIELWARLIDTEKTNEIDLQKISIGCDTTKDDGQ